MFRSNNHHQVAQCNLHRFSMHLILLNLLFIQLNAKINCSKNVKIYMKIYTKSTATCFGLTTIIRELTVCTFLKL
jgi:hypothetical protein